MNKARAEVSDRIVSQPSGKLMSGPPTEGENTHSVRIRSWNPFAIMNLLIPVILNPATLLYEITPQPSPCLSLDTFAKRVLSPFRARDGTHAVGTLCECILVEPSYWKIMKVMEHAHCIYYPRSLRVQTPSYHRSIVHPSHCFWIYPYPPTPIGYCTSHFIVLYFIIFAAFHIYYKASVYIAYSILQTLLE